MSQLLRKIEFPWVMENVAEPFFSYSGSCLNVYFMVFLGIEERKKDINNYLLRNFLHDESDMPDDKYNNAGYKMANFDFKSFDFFYCTDKISGLSKYSNGSELSSGFCEEINENNEFLGYVFIGHDLFLSVKARKYIISISDVL
ncbi:hypothetical protein [Pectobacterium wasabiae]|uniref:Uncharacterized protein n=1 Tax=Pectobacterium wasabiae TaxID=55208 RepID=A0AAW3EBG0_9GAMM|nr:hypothetical protein [Pectobacterium wasabiae]AOR62954.1 hypothetical protein A7983_06735 [Pectobacterium wasabiae CFBP 3304]EJS93641.1 Hypothetical protein Y17_3099 [Pectobacterium wasabiae CFBP 3304]KFX02434.1 hypothetical protein JV38_22160 [Pectobacterium wasabiae]KGA26356.1 hypothetical protein KU73_21625 [Pectobacterium wasabiae]